MTQRKFSNYFAIFITILITIAVIGLRFIGRPSSENRTQSYSFVSKTNDDSGPMLGSRIIKTTKLRINGIETNLDLKAIKKPKFLIFMTGPNTCHRCVQSTLESVNDLTEKFKDEAAIYLLFNGRINLPPNNDLIVNPKIQQVEGANALIQRLKSQTPRIIFIDRENTITYFMELPQGREGWDQAYQKMNSFINTGIPLK